MRMDSRIANEVREINAARERTAPKRPSCPLCNENYPNIHVADKELDIVYMVCLSCAKEFIAKFGPGASGDELCKKMRHLTPLTLGRAVGSDKPVEYQPELFPVSLVGSPARR